MVKTKFSQKKNFGVIKSLVLYKLTYQILASYYRPALVEMYEFVEMAEMVDLFELVKLFKLVALVGCIDLIEFYKLAELVRLVEMVESRHAKRLFLSGNPILAKKNSGQFILKNSLK